jgi:hypothetical protein
MTKIRGYVSLLNKGWFRDVHYVKLIPKFLYSTDAMVLGSRVVRNILVKCYVTGS